MTDRVSDLASRLGCGTEIAAYAVAFKFTPRLLRDNGDRDVRCSLWDCDGDLAFLVNGRTIWDEDEDFEEAIEAYGFSDWLHEEVEDDDDE